MAPNALAPWSSSSYGLGGIYIGRIESIDDPLRRNRVQVRLFGYQNDQGTIPKDQLEWVHVIQHNSQIAGATSTHFYLPGAQVAVQQIGTELMVIGAMPGFDSDKRNQGDDKAGQSSQPDTPATVQGEGKEQAQAKDGNGRDVIQLKREPKANTYLQTPDEKKGYDYAKGNAPFEKGDTAKFTDMMSIGIDKLLHGSDVLNVIRQMDGNLSGAIKSALDIIQNLRQNGFGTSKDVIGSGPISAAANQFASDFGASPALSLLNIIRELIVCAGITKGITTANVVVLYNDGSLVRVVTSLRPQSLGVSPNVLTQMQGVVGNIGLAAPGFNYQPLITQFQSEFLTGLLTAVTSIIGQINALATATGGGSAFVQAFGDQKSFTEIAADLASLSASVGIPKESIYAIAGGAVGAALKGQLGNFTSQQSTSSSGGGQNAGALIQKVSAMLNMFAGNPVALSELTSGQLNPQSLLKIPLKYAPKPTNHPTKKFVDDVKSDIATA